MGSHISLRSKNVYRRVSRGSTHKKIVEYNVADVLYLWWAMVGDFCNLEVGMKKENREKWKRKKQVT